MATFMSFAGAEGPLRVQIYLVLNVKPPWKWARIIEAVTGSVPDGEQQLPHLCIDYRPALVKYTDEGEPDPFLTRNN